MASLHDTRTTYTDSRTADTEQTSNSLLQEQVLWKLLLLTGLAYLMWSDNISIILGPVSINEATEQAEGGRVQAAIFEYPATPKKDRKSHLPEVQVTLPAGALNVVPGLGEEAGAALSAHPGVQHLSFTGSVAVGRLIQTAAAKHTIPVTLELGGKSPQIVFADADLDAALPFLVNAGIQNAGQTCSAASRILVERGVFDEVVARMAERYRALRVGPALDDLDVGPVISARQREIVEGYLAVAHESGLHIAATAGRVASAPAGGYYVPPTLVADVVPGHRLAQEEIFLLGSLTGEAGMGQRSVGSIVIRHDSGVKIRGGEQAKREEVGFCLPIGPAVRPKARRSAALHYVFRRRPVADAPSPFAIRQGLRPVLCLSAST